jgi:ATP-dependent exoDNAse (exonuclease V) beta subunit
VPSSVVPVPIDFAARRCFSFSRLRGTLNSAPAIDPEAEFAGQTPLDPLGFGTLVHELLERIAFGGSTNVRALCEFIAPHHLNSPSSAEIDEASQIVERFLKSARATEIAAAQCVLKELEFLLPWPASGSERYLRGYIDCLYQDARGEWHLIDYKSNQITAEGVPASAQEYEMQMFVYALACERAFGIRPRDIAVCFLRPGMDFKFQWNESQIVELTSRIDRAVEALTTIPSVNASTAHGR